MSQVAQARIVPPVWPPRAAENVAATRDVSTGAIFASHAERSRLLERWHDAGFALCRIDHLSPLHRGRLTELIEDACDARIAALGGPPPGLGAFGSASERLRDRRFRFHRAGRTGVAIVLGSLAPLALGHGALAPEDGETLRALASMEGPFAIVLDDADQSLGVFQAPIALHALLHPPATPAAHAAHLPAATPEPPTTAPASRVVEVEEITEIASALAVAVATEAEDDERCVSREGDADVTHGTREPREAQTHAHEAAPPAGGSHTDEPAAAPRLYVDEVPEAPDEHVFLPVAKPDEKVPARVVADLKTIAPRETPWRAHAAALTAARGPQPLAEFERLFVEHYMPLLQAIERGLDDARARATAEEFRHTFARSYSEAFPTFLVTGRRPRLVLDATEIAGRIARLHGARGAQLLLVDGMRWDIGMLVRDTLSITLGPQASLADEMFLMAALPSTTSRQLAGLARGLDGLRASLVDTTDGEALGGRTSEIVRRVRVGNRDMYKLDLVEARVREAEHVPDQFHEIARRTADAITRHAATLPPRSLLFVFGDHGFSIDAAGEMHQGGASPEEVLVPAFAFLLGMVQ